LRQNAIRQALQILAAILRRHDGEDNANWKRANVQRPAWLRLHQPDAERQKTFLHLRAYPFGEIPEVGARVIYDVAPDARSGRLQAGEWRAKNRRGPFLAESARAILCLKTKKTAALAGGLGLPFRLCDL
jgi:hypothetical protein